MIGPASLFMMGWVTLAQPVETQAQATVYWVNHCQSEAAAGTSANFREACACVAGLMAGKTTPRQYRLMAELAPGLSSPERMSTILQRLLDQGYAAEEIQSVGQLMEDSQDDIDQVCKILE